MTDWVVTFDGLEPALIRAASHRDAIRAACALCGSEAIAAETDIRARRVRSGEDRHVPREVVHDWHHTDDALTACGLPVEGLHRAFDDGQATCPGCLEELAGERRAGNVERAREAGGPPGGEAPPQSAAVGRTVVM